MNRLVVPLGLLILILVSCGKDNPTEPNGNQEPNPPSNPAPVNGALDQATSLTLSWQCSDPDGDTILFDIFLGLSPNPPLLFNNRREQDTCIVTSLIYDTTYYWKIIAKDRYSQTVGPVWHFTTIQQPNSPPLYPSDPNPPDWSMLHSTDVTLSWQCADPDEDTLVYDIYLGTADNPPLIASNQPTQSYVPQALQFYSEYFWKVTAKDEHDAETEGPVWKFWTGLHQGLMGTVYTLPTHGYDAMGVFVAGSRAYLGYGRNLSAINIENPYYPEYVWTASITGNAQKVFVSDKAYITGYYGRFWMVSIGGSYLGDYDAPDHTQDIFVVNQYAYVTFTNISRLQVVNVADSQHPTLVGSASLPGHGYTIVVQNQYAYIAGGQYGVFVLDISNPSTPTLLNSFGTPSTCYDVCVDGNYLYAAIADSGLEIIDITTPASPQLVGSYRDCHASCIYKQYNFLHVGNELGVEVISVVDPQNPVWRAGRAIGSIRDISVSAIPLYVYVATAQELRILGY